jgi:hypothetical protein
MGWTAGFRFPAAASGFLFFIVSRPAMVHAQPPTYRILEALSTGVNGRSVKLISHLYLVPRSIMVGIYIHSPIRLHGVVLN